MLQRVLVPGIIFWLLIVQVLILFLYGAAFTILPFDCQDHCIPSVYNQMGLAGRVYLGVELPLGIIWVSAVAYWISHSRTLAPFWHALGAACVGSFLWVGLTMLMLGLFRELGCGNHDGAGVRTAFYTGSGFGALATVALSRRSWRSALLALILAVLIGWLSFVVAFAFVGVGPECDPYSISF